MHTHLVFAGLVASALAQTLTGPEDCLSAASFQLCQNLWGASTGIGNQNSTLVSASDDSISWSTAWTWADIEDGVKSYANVEHSTAKGMQLQNIASAPTTWNWVYMEESPGIRANVAYDLWVGEATSGTPASANSDFEIMIWLSSKGTINPIGPSPNTTGINLSGHTWDLWYGVNQNWEVLSYVRVGDDIDDFTADLNDFFDDLTTNRGVASSQFLHSIQVGTEAFTGSANLVTNSYSVSVSTA